MARSAGTRCVWPWTAPLRRLLACAALTPSRAAAAASTCPRQTFYTKDAFRTAPLTLLSETTQCSFAHQSKDFISDAPAETNSLIFCIAFSPLEGSGSKGDAHSIAESRLYKSDNWFGSMELVDFSVGKESSGVVGLGVVSKFVVAALRADVTGGGGTGGGGGDPMNMFGADPLSLPRALALLSSC